MNIQFKGLYVNLEQKQRKTDGSIYGVITFLDDVTSKSINALVKFEDIKNLRFEKFQEYLVTCNLEVGKYTRIDFIQAVAFKDLDKLK